MVSYPSIGSATLSPIVFQYLSIGSREKPTSCRNVFSMIVLQERLGSKVPLSSS